MPVDPFSDYAHFVDSAFDVLVTMVSSAWVMLAALMIRYPNADDSFVDCVALLVVVALGQSYQMALAAHPYCMQSNNRWHRVGAKTVVPTMNSDTCYMKNSGR